MNKFLLSALLALVAINCVFTADLANSCSPECGGNSVNDCTDFKEVSSDPNKCITCSPGNIGGATGGALCKSGRPAPGCTASLNSTDSTKCYVCQLGFFDPVNNPLIMTPCNACHPTCGSCAGPNANQCFTCANGYFDSSANPYISGTCDPCDSKCTNCLRKSNNCNGCCKLGFVRDANGSCVAN